MSAGVRLGDQPEPGAPMSTVEVRFYPGESRASGHAWHPTITGTNALTVSALTGTLTVLS